jgi:lipoprotein-anchoring transpeptidase ErfK/SrfK
MRKNVLAALVACCSLIIAPVNAGQLKFDPATFKMYGGMAASQTASLITPQESSETNHRFKIYGGMAGDQTASLITPQEFSETSHRIVDFFEPMEAGSILIRTSERRLYYVLPNKRAIMYPVGVGREGFAWSGQNEITRKATWPDWRPPRIMIEREARRGHVIPAFMAGGPENPLGARALYIGDTEYRIHGTTQPWSIGRAVSSGCIRMMNVEVIDLFNRVEIGATVIVE